MNKIFSTALKTQIIIALGFVFLGFYTGADQLKVLEVKDGMATVKVPEGQTLSADQVLYTEQMATESDQAQRNGFVTAYLMPFYNFNAEQFAVSILTSYGEVFRESPIFDAGILEGTVAVSGQFSKEGWGATIGIGTEINFMKNDGINKLIPGLKLGIDWTDIQLKKGRGTSIALSVATYLKAFVSKQFAIMPVLQLSYGTGNYQPKGDDIILGLGVGLRRYF